VRPLVPRPVSSSEPGGNPVVLGARIKVAAPSELFSEARFLRRLLEQATAGVVELVDTEAPAEVSLRLSSEPSPSGVEGAYELAVGDGQVVIAGDSPRGVFYGIETLSQLLPARCLRAAGRGEGEVSLEPVSIKDYPRFSWRGVHLDVCRHFMPKGFVLKLIDLAAFHKLNVFHFHLTEDQGWRMPVEAFPLLTEVGAWRACSPVGHSDENRFDDQPHGGFYTREDIAEIVAYAAERHIEVLPEIEMPGHMVAAIAAYPELGESDEPAEVLTEWGISEQVLNLEDHSIEFCKQVVDEVVELFPSRYFHLGGDECPTKQWERSPRARELMEANGLSDPRQLQGWFTAIMAKHLEGHGRTLVGWDEILEGGAPKGAVVMSWRGEEGGIAAASAGHDVVMAPEEWLYFDWAYADDPAEPLAIRGATPVEKVYGYDPVAKEIPADKAHHVLGAQCQLWTEYVPTPEHAEYLYFPRLCALAEAVWSPPGERSYPEFETRLASHLERLEALGVNYRPLDGPTPGQARRWRDPRDSATRQR
jgi:hexosaminidase